MLARQAAVDVGCKIWPRHRGRGVQCRGNHHTQRRGLRPQLRAAPVALEGWALAVRDVKDRVGPGQILSALRRVRRRRTGRGIARSDSGGGTSEPAVRSELKVVTQVIAEASVAVIAVVDSRVTAAGARPCRRGCLRSVGVSGERRLFGAAYVCTASVQTKLPSQAAAR